MFSCHGEQEGSLTPRWPNYMCLSFHYVLTPVSGLSHPLCRTRHLPSVLHPPPDGMEVTVGRGSRAPGVVGKQGGGPCPSLPPAAPTPGMRTRRGSPGSGGIGAPLVRRRSKAAGCLPLSPVHKPSTFGHSLDAGGPEGLAWTERSTQYLYPRRAPGLGAAALLSLYFTHSLRSTIHPLGITVSLQTKQSRGHGRTEKGTNRGLSRSSRPWAPRGVSGHCSGAGRRGPAGSSASP